MRLFTFPEAAEHCSVNVKTLRKHAKEGLLETVTTPLGLRVGEDSLLPYLGAKAGRQEPLETNEDQSAPVQTRPEETVADQCAPVRAIVHQEAPDQVAPSSTRVDHDAPVQAGQSAPLETKGDQSAPAQTIAIPLEAHLAALKLVESALEKAAQAEAKIEEQRNRAEFSERRRLALEMQLRQYQLALADQAESLSEAYARQQTAELQLESMKASVEVASEQSGAPASSNLPFRLDTPKPSFGQKLKRWFGLSKAV